MAFWSYHRKFHLILLLILLCVFLMERVIFAVMHGFMLETLMNIYWDLSCVLFLILWFLRGMTSTRCLFPWFHYVSLIFEWLVLNMCFAIIMYYTAKIFINIGDYFIDNSVEIIYYIGINLTVALIYLLILFK